jgi:E3 ubiquitin-protein ligase UBR7
MDRVRAIEGVMAYNHVKDKVKAFLQPFAESGQPVGAEEIRAYFAKLRGDEMAEREAMIRAEQGGSGGGGYRRGQEGY